MSSAPGPADPSLDVPEFIPEPAAAPAPEPKDAATAMRLAHLARESTVKTIALTYFIGAALILVNAALLLGSEKLWADMIAQVKLKSISSDGLRVFMMAFFGVSTVIALLLGLGLRALWNSVRWVVVIFALLGALSGLMTVLGLLANPDMNLDVAVSLGGLLVSLTFALFLGSAKTAPVFAHDYRHAVVQTPDIRPSFGLRDQAFLLLYLVVAAAGLVSQILKMR